MAPGSGDPVSPTEYDTSAPLPWLIAVVRSASPLECRTIVRGLVEAGVPGIEITMTVPDGVQLIREFAPEPVVLGAGTVLDVATAEACVHAGAAFLVSPVSDAEVVGAAHDAGVPYVGGALTPTEIHASLRMGCDAVKIFPIGSIGGARYLETVREPLPELRAVVSGGVEPGDATAYFRAGAVALCMGGALIDRAAARRGDAKAVADKAAEALAAIGEVAGDA